MKCDYGCDNEGIYYFKLSKRWCCQPHYMKCEYQRKKYSGDRNPFYGKKHTKENIKKNIEFNKNRKQTNQTKEKIKNSSLELWKDSKFRQKVLKNLRRRTIEMIKYKYSLFSKIEEMRYNPDKPNEKEIQVHCKNHLCENSKEKNGWFTPSGRQIEGRLWAIETENGNGGSYFYCSEECKNTCILYGLQNDPYEIKDVEKPYIESEYQTFRTFVLERDNYICQYCGELATIVHHEKPQKLEPFFALDPDYAWSCCKNCHYEKGHKNECSTGNLASMVC